VLRSAVAGDRLAHAYVFVGPRGVGKGLAARQLAKLLLCASPRGNTAETVDCCDTCNNCRRVDRQVHPDLFWFRKEPDRNDFRINLVVRGRGDGAEGGITVTESAALYPMEAQHSVIVLDDAELLNRAAANALLKTLEEPSPHAVLILLAADASQLPGTVLSRCQWVRFGPLPEEFVAEKVREALATKAEETPAKGRKGEPPQVSPAQIAFVARFAGGSIEQARLLAGAGLWELKRQIIAQLAHMDAAGALDMAAAVSAWAEDRCKAAQVRTGTPEGNAVRRSSAVLALGAVASAFGDAALMAAGAGIEGRLVNDDQRQAIETLARWPADALARAVGVLADGQAHVGRYVHTELATENALVQVSRLRPQSARS
jgi:DNA polymerase III delta prime subunit